MLNQKRDLCLREVLDAFDTLGGKFASSDGFSAREDVDKVTIRVNYRFAGYKY